MTESSEPTTYIQEIINQYTDSGQIDTALDEARQQVFKLMTNTTGGIPHSVMLEAMELWMFWSLRIIVGGMASIVVQAEDDWDDEQGEALVENLLTTFHLLKEHAMRTIIEMRIEGNDEQA